MYLFYKEWFWMIDIYEAQASEVVPQLITNWLTFLPDGSKEITGIYQRPTGEVVIFVVRDKHNTALVPILQITSQNTTDVPDMYISSNAVPELTNYATTSLGSLVADYINRRNERTFGIVGVADKKNYIGNSEVIFDNDNLIIEGTKYKATKGLMALLTLNDISKDDGVKPDDIINYGDILFKSGAIYQNNVPNSNHSKSEKYNTIIKPIWDRKMGIVRDKDGKPIKNKKQVSAQYFSPPLQRRLRTQQSLSDSDTGSGRNSPSSSGRNSPIDGVFGSGLHKYTELPKEYVWMNDVRKLVDRLVVILGEEESGNDNLYNEKVSIMKMFSDTLSKFYIARSEKYRSSDKDY
ncbi:hypothetical protein C0J52_13228 [Blattella germanica]|nr:hypothetical protein C0J52_13228 [Blattella germanica]